MKTIRTIFLLFFVVILWSCNNSDPTTQETNQKLTIFFVNDVHGKIDNFGKVKHIIDQERAKNDVLVACSGDLFSGNPVVDNYAEKGYPIINLMNEIGFDVSVLGNHEFDYGAATLKNRINQSNFPWLCANAGTDNNNLAQPAEYVTLTIEDLKVTFLGLIETWGSNYITIPSSHPWRVQDYTFQNPFDVVNNYYNLKEQENADILIALSHLGVNADFQLAKTSSFFDLIIGGHSHSIVDTIYNNIPIYQSGAYLHYLGKIQLTINNRSIQSSDFTLINLDSYSDTNADLQALIDDYNDWPELDEKIGFATNNHSYVSTGCFYTNAIQGYLNVDVSFQNTGGIRALLNYGPITKRDIYEISPFNNGTVIYNMSVAEIKTFLTESGSGFYYSGIQLNKEEGNLVIRDSNGRKIPDDYILTVGLNDYIPAVHSLYFPDNGAAQPLTAAESIIAYLENLNNEIDYSDCWHYFKF